MSRIRQLNLSIETLKLVVRPSGKPFTPCPVAFRSVEVPKVATVAHALKKITYVALVSEMLQVFTSIKINIAGRLRGGKKASAAVGGTLVGVLADALHRNS